MSASSWIRGRGLRVQQRRQGTTSGALGRAHTAKSAQNRCAPATWRDSGTCGGPRSESSCLGSLVQMRWIAISRYGLGPGFGVQAQASALGVGGLGSGVEAGESACGEDIAAGVPRGGEGVVDVLTALCNALPSAGVHHLQRRPRSCCHHRPDGTCSRCRGASRNTLSPRRGRGKSTRACVESPTTTASFPSGATAV